MLSGVPLGGSVPPVPAPCGSGFWCTQSGDEGGYVAWRIPKTLPGWFPDPGGQPVSRWWDGSQTFAVGCVAFQVFSVNFVEADERGQ